MQKIHSILINKVSHWDSLTRRIFSRIKLFLTICFTFSASKHKHLSYTKAQEKLEEGWLMEDRNPWLANDSHDHPGMIQVR